MGKTRKTCKPGDHFHDRIAQINQDRRKSTACSCGFFHSGEQFQQVMMAHMKTCPREYLSFDNLPEKQKQLAPRPSNIKKRHAPRFCGSTGNDDVRMTAAAQHNIRTNLCQVSGSVVEYVSSHHLRGVEVLMLAATCSHFWNSLEDVVVCFPLHGWCREMKDILTHSHFVLAGVCLHVQNCTCKTTFSQSKRRKEGNKQLREQLGTCPNYYRPCQPTPTLLVHNAPLIDIVDLTPLNDLKQCASWKSMDLSALNCCNSLYTLRLPTKASICTNLSSLQQCPLRILEARGKLEESDWLGIQHMETLRVLNIGDQPCIESANVTEHLTSLRLLHLDHCDRLHDITALSNLVLLIELNLSYCPSISDITALAHMAFLKKLSLKNTPVAEMLGESLQPLSLCPLQELDLSMEPYLDRYDRYGHYGWSVGGVTHREPEAPSDLHHLGTNLTLRTLRLGRISRSSNGSTSFDLTALAPLSLYELDLHNCSRFNNLSSLSGACLHTLNVSHDAEQDTLVDISALAQCPAIRDLNLRNRSALVDLSALACTPLQAIDLTGCPWADLSPLAECEQLTEVHLTWYGGDHLNQVNVGVLRECRIEVQYSFEFAPQTLFEGEVPLYPQQHSEMELTKGAPGMLCDEHACISYDSGDGSDYEDYHSGDYIKRHHPNDSKLECVDFDAMTIKLQRTVRRFLQSNLPNHECKRLPELKEKTVGSSVRFSAVARASGFEDHKVGNATNVQKRSAAGPGAVPSESQFCAQGRRGLPMATSNSFTLLFDGSESGSDDACLD